MEKQLKKIFLELEEEVSKNEIVLPPDFFSKKDELLIGKNPYSHEEKKHYFDVHLNRYFYTLNKIKDIKKGKILEVGPAYLHLSMALIKLGHELFGVDIPLFCQNTEIKKRAEKYNITVKPCDLSKDQIPFPDNYFDYITLTEVLEHFNFSPLNTFSETNRVLKKDGLLVITVPNYNKFENLINFFTRRGMTPNIEYLLREPASTLIWKEYALKDLKRILNLTSFKIIKAEYYSFNTKYYLRNKLIDLILNSFFFQIPLKIITFLIPMFRGGIFVMAKKIDDLNLENL